MIRLLLFIGLLAYTSTGCLRKECYLTQNTAAAPQEEQTALQNFITANNITATKDPSGYFYQILEPGGDRKPTLCSNLTVTYTGSLTDGTVFDSGTTSFLLSTLIEGWKRALPKIGEGGKIKMYLPPSFAYGPNEIPPSGGRPGIPANSILIFEVELKDIF